MERGCCSLDMRGECSLDMARGCCSLDRGESVV